MKDLIGKMDAIQGVQTTNLPSTPTTPTGPKLLNERNQSMDIGEAGGFWGTAADLGLKGLGKVAGGLERSGNAVVQGTKGAFNALAGKTPRELAAAAKEAEKAAAKKALSQKTADLQAKATAAMKAGDPNAAKLTQQAAAAAKKAPAPTFAQKAGDVAAKTGKATLGAATLGGLAYGGKKAYDALTKDDNKPEPGPAPGPAPGPKPPSPAPKPPVVGPTTDTPADDVDPRIDPYKPDTPNTNVIQPAKTDMPNMQRPSILPPNTMAQNLERARRNLDSMGNQNDLDNEIERAKKQQELFKIRQGTLASTGDFMDKEMDRDFPSMGKTSAVPEKPARDYSTGRPVDKELDANYGTGNTRTDKDGRTYVRQKGVMGQPDSEQRSYASFGDFANKIMGKGDVNGRMDEEVEQLLDAIIEAQEIDRITGLSGINEAVSSDYYRDYENAVRGGDNWKDAKNYKAIKDPLQGSKAYEKDSPYGYGRYGKNSADLQKYINQLGYKDKKGNALSVDARMGPKTGIAVDALRRKLDPNSAEFKTLRAFDDAAMLGDKDSRQTPPPKKVTPTKPTNTTDVPAPSNKPDSNMSALGGGLGAPVIPGINASATTPTPPSSSMNASSLRAKLDAASGKDTATPASTSAMPNSDDSGQPVLKTADEWQKDKDARQPKGFQQMGMVGQDFEESVMREAIEIARIANLSGVTLSEAKMKDLASKKVKGSYGTEYQGDEDEEETTDKKSKAKDSEKKKRGGQFKGDKDTSGKEKFGGADDAMAAMGVGKAKKSKSLDKLPAKKHSLKEYFDETEAIMIAEAQHAGIMGEVADAMFQLETALFESAGLLDEAQCLEHICECYPHEVKLFLDTGNLDPDLFHELSDHYKRHARVPHRIARERDVTPLFDLVKGLFEGDLGMNAEVTQAEEPMEVDEGIEDALQNILPKSMQPFNNQTAAAASKAQAPVREASKPW